MRHGRIRGALLAGVILTVALAAPVGAITNGQPDDEEHPYVGQLFFYVPDEEDDRFDDPGSWFNCTLHSFAPWVSSARWASVGGRFLCCGSFAGARSCVAARGTRSAMPGCARLRRR